MLEHIKDWTWNHWVVAIFTFAGTVGPGFLGIMLYKPELLVELDVIKLVLIALATTIPFAFLHLVMLILFPLDDEHIQSEKGKLGYVVVALWLSSAYLHANLALAYFFDWSPQKVLISMAMFQVASTAAFYLVHWKRERAKKAAQ